MSDRFYLLFEFTIRRKKDEESEKERKKQSHYFISVVGFVILCFGGIHFLVVISSLYCLLDASIELVEGLGACFLRFS